MQLNVVIDLFETNNDLNCLSIVDKAVANRHKREANPEKKTLRFFRHFSEVLSRSWGRQNSIRKILWTPNSDRMF